MQPGSVATKVYVPAWSPPIWYAPVSSARVEPFSGPNQEIVEKPTFESPTTAPWVGDGDRSMSVLLPTLSGR